MIRVGQDQARFQVFQVSWGDRFDGRLSAHRRKDGRQDGAVRRMKNPRACGSIDGIQLVAEGEEGMGQHYTICRCRSNADKQHANVPTFQFTNRPRDT